MKSVCVYCGSSPGNDAAYREAAVLTGRALAQSGRTLIFGGGRVGLMGALADAALAAGGRVIGVIPQALVDKEVAHRNLTELRVVASMHERKALMAELSDGFLTLPGGVGTLEEFFETWTWGQLGLHAKPYGLLDVGGFFGPMLRFLDRMVEQGFLRSESRSMLLVSGEVAGLLDAMARHKPLATVKWIDAEDT